MKFCYQCGATFLPEQMQEITLDLNDEKLWICQDCARRILLIAGQVKVPGWIAGVWQPRNLSQLASQRGYTLSQDELADLCEMGRNDCMALLQERYDEFWRDLGIGRWLKDLEIIKQGEVEK